MESGVELKSGVDERPLVLIAEDAGAQVRLMQICMERAGCRVAAARDGREALTALEKERPAFIILDIEMPGINGLETLRRIKEQPVLQDIPVVMMTGVCGEAEMKRAAEYGANSYTLKPANAEQFLRTVLASTSYWLTIHQYPEHHIPPECCRR